MATMLLDADAHPSRIVDRNEAATIVAASINRRGPHWDALSNTCRPDLVWDGAMHAGDILLAVQEHMQDEIPCSYRGGDLSHPDAMRAIDDWCRIRSDEKAEQLAGLPIDDRGTVFVERVIACRAEDLRSTIGVFWTTDVQHGGILSAPWGSDRTDEILITARIHHSHVDWQASCMARMDWYSGDCELELRLRPDRPLVDVAAWSWDQSLIEGRRRRLVLPDLDWTT